MELVWRNTQFSGFGRKRALASQLDTRGLALLKTSTSASGLEQRRKEGGPLLLFKKIQAQSLALLAHAREVSVPARTRLDSFPSTASFQVRVRISQMTRRGTRKKTSAFTWEQSFYVMFGQLYWTREATLCLDRISRFSFFFG